LKVYLAAPYGEMKLMLEWEQKLKLAGHKCTANWIHGNEEGMSLNDAAQMDLNDIDSADAVICLCLPKGTMFSSGGRHVEFGYGLATHKLMIVVNAGKPENIFHHLDRVLTVENIEQAVEWLAQLMKRRYSNTCESE
jgi:hypothetical protein